MVKKITLMAISILVGISLITTGDLAYGKDNVNYNCPLSIKTLDTYMAADYVFVYFAWHWGDTLAYPTRDGKLVPLLAKSWQAIGDKAIEFKLRRDVKFHNGEPFNAESVKFTLEYMVNPANKVYRRKHLKWIDHVEIVDDFTARVVMKKPTPIAMLILSRLAPMYPSKYFQKVGAAAFGRHPIGTGPYKFLSWKEGGDIKFEINKQYFKGSPKGIPKIRYITMKSILEPTTIVAEMLAGNIDHAYIKHLDQVAGVEKSKNVMVVKKNYGVSTRFVRMDVSGRSGDTPLKKAKVRQAVAHAINKKQIVNDLLSGMGRVSHSIVHPEMFGYNPDIKKYAYDPGKAKKLLAEAGYPDGFEIEFWSYKEKPVFLAIARNLEEVGIKCKIKYMEGNWPALQKYLKAGKIPISYHAWSSMGIYDGQVPIYDWLHSKSSFSYVSDPQLDGWVDEISGTLDQKRRKGILSKLQNRIADDAYIVPIYILFRPFVKNPKLDYEIPDDGSIRFFEASWKE